MLATAAAKALFEGTRDVILLDDGINRLLPPSACLVAFVCRRECVASSRAGEATASFKSRRPL